MDEDFYLRLIYKELDGSASEKEAAELAAWLEESPENRDFAAGVREAWAASSNLAAEPEVDLDTAFGMLEAQLQSDPEVDYPSEAETIPLAPTPRRNPNWIAIAAGIAALLVIGWLALPFLQGEAEADWKTVYAEGEPLEINLPDGSIATLNKNSTLSYLTETDTEQRVVKLEGEGFFEVKPGAKPFVVQTELTEVTVLGTSFNVRSYPDASEVRVQVSTGKVRFAPKGSDAELLLLPGDRGIYAPAAKTLRKEANAKGKDGSWRLSELAFEDTPLMKALLEMEMLFDIDIDLEAPDADKCPLTGDFEGLEIEEALESIATILGGELEVVEQGKYVLSGVGCE